MSRPRDRQRLRVGVEGSGSAAGVREHRQEERAGHPALLFPAVLSHPRLSSGQLTPSRLTPIIFPNLIRQISRYGAAGDWSMLMTRLQGVTILVNIYCFLFFLTPLYPPHSPFPRRLWHEGSAPAGRGSAAGLGHRGWRNRAAWHGLAWHGSVRYNLVRHSSARLRCLPDRAAPCPLVPSPCLPSPLPVTRTGGRRVKGAGVGGQQGPEPCPGRVSSCRIIYSPRGRQAPRSGGGAGVPGGPSTPGSRAAGHQPPLPGPPCVQPSSVTGLLLGKSDLDQ